MVDDLLVALVDVGILLGNASLKVVNAGLQAGNLVLKVLYGLGQFAADDLNLVDFRIYKLQGVEGYKTTLDGEVNIGDLNAVIDMILSGLTEANADVNGDGEVNIADVNAIITLISGGN